MDAPPATYVTEDYDLTKTSAKNYALTFVVVFPSACRYATIDHALGDRSDHSVGMLRSVSTSENTRIMDVVGKENEGYGTGYPAVQAMYAAMFP